jgi:hypothetical protein
MACMSAITVVSTWMASETYRSDLSDTVGS